MKQTSRLLTVTMVAMLAGCAGAELEKAEKQSPVGSAFQNDLYAGYIDLSSSEYAEGDYRDSDYFARKAMTAGTGEIVQPTMIKSRNLPSDKEGILTSSRQRLMAAMAAGAADKASEDAARAQVMFDCWMQEQEENFQLDDIEACRTGFYEALKMAEKAVAPVPVPVAAAPAPPPPPEAQTFVLYFGTDYDELDKDAQALLSEVRAAASKMDGAKITVAGFTDTEGTSKYNLGLSDRRAEAVAHALADAAAQKIDTISFGQNNQAVPTGDGVEESLNRRVEITVSP
jgi:outer membrane protein OmpA-like peptidoglycan-associated protein